MSSASSIPEPAPSGWVTFLSDYSLDDHFVGVCKGVIARIAPAARVLDICHQVKAQDLTIGARLLADAVPYMPVGVHLALVDPYERGAVRPIAVRCGDGSVIVAPDNGVASLAWVALGGIDAVRGLTNAGLQQPNPARSFRGRDIFAPVAAHLAAGVPFEQVGEPLDPGSLATIEPRAPEVHGDHVHGAIRMIDHFGNLQLNVTRADLEVAGVGLGDTVEVRAGGIQARVPFTLSFSEVPVGHTCLYEDSFRAITIVTNMGRAESELNAVPGDPIVLARVQSQPAGRAARG